MSEVGAECSELNDVVIIPRLLNYVHSHGAERSRIRKVLYCTNATSLASHILCRHRYFPISHASGLP